MKTFKGVGVALVTPFTNRGAIDFEALRKLIDYTIAGGVDYIVSLGTTGETATLSHEEKLHVWNATLEYINGRIPAVAGYGGNNTNALVAGLGDIPEGFSAILSVSPYYNKPTQEGIYRHYQKLSEHTDRDIVLYNVPGRTGTNITWETTCRLAGLKNIPAIKEASGNLEQMAMIMANKPEAFELISGDDVLTLPIMAIGGVGVISVSANAIPYTVSRLVRAAQEKEYNTAKELHNGTMQLTTDLFTEGNPAGIKALLAAKGICTDDVRLPLVPVSEKLRHIMAGHAGVWE